LLLVLSALLTCAGNRVLAGTVAEPTISGPSAGFSSMGGLGYFPDKDGAMSAPFRAVQGFSALAIEVSVPDTRVRNFAWKSNILLLGWPSIREGKSTVLPARWREQLAAQLPLELAAAASRAGIATVRREDVPPCPEDRRATVGRLVVEVLGIETLPLPATIGAGAPPGGSVVNVMLRTRLGLTDNCDRELKTVAYAPIIGFLRAQSVEDFLERWITPEERAEVPQDAAQMSSASLVEAGSPGLIAEAMVTGGLLVWIPAWPPKVVLEQRSTPYTLSAISPADSPNSLNLPFKKAPVMASDLTLRWESLPELLAALGPAELASRLSEVRYELVVYREQQGTNAQASAVRVPVFRSADLTSAEWNGSDALEPCESFAWSFRAHFRLDGFPRVTAWSGLHNGLGYMYWPDLVWPNYLVHHFRTPPPPGFKECH
jgi:hypothetical protein